MNTITYNNDDLKDGAGAQIQRILSIFILSKYFKIPYLHSPLVECQHIDADTVKRFNELIHLPSRYTKNLTITSYIHFNKLLLSIHINTLIKITAAHLYIDANPHILNINIPEFHFPWIQETLSKSIRIAIHIRRGDVSPSSNKERYIDLSYYLDCIDTLSNIFSGINHTIEIYSESSIEEELLLAKNRLESIPNLIYHLDEDVIDTFKSLVNADILFAGFSSFSYSAHMLRRKGITLYTPFIHKYSNNSICIDTPNKILKYKDRILNSIV